MYSDHQDLISNASYLTLMRARLGTSARMISVATMQATPPLTTERMGVNNPATRPDSNWPSMGPPITNIALTALMRPRNSSGVVSCTTMLRRIILTMSAAPDPARKSAPSQSGEGKKPKAMMHKPQKMTAKATPRP